MTAHQKILVGIDKSSRSEAVFEHACELAKLQDAKLMLFHCLTLPAATQDFGDRYNADLIQFMDLAKQQIDNSVEETRRWLSGFVKDAEDRGIAVEWDWRVGQPGHQLCAIAKDWGADLIVVGRRGHRRVQEVLLGSVSNYILHRAQCSVMVVQGEA